MHQMNFPVGVSDFAKIRENKYYYIDKTSLIRELLKTESTEVTLITRPRRFGKTLGMSMLAEFFDIRRDSAILFAGLEVAEDKEQCAEWMNQWPTLFLTFKDVSGLTFEKAYGLLRFVIAQICVNHAYLEDSKNVDEAHRMIFKRLKMQTGTETDVQSALLVIMEMMQAHYGKSVILLIDEYDVPAAKASSNGYYQEMLDVIARMLSQALKDNKALKFAVITGCLRIAKESIFTGTNNLKSDTISNTRLSEYFGFTDGEVRKLLQDTGCGSYAEKIRKWYDGYHFGDVDVYCPWDVLSYVDELNNDPVSEPKNFWANTSDNAIIGTFLGRTDFVVNEKFEILLSGGYIKENITENLTYDVLESSEGHFWSLLYLTGYLTRVRRHEVLPEESIGNQVALKIPNAEIMEIFRKSVEKWFDNKSVTSDRRELFAALWNADAKRLTQLLSDLLFDTISYHDYRESFYHAFLSGLFSSAGYIVESNYENGLGRSDIVIKDRKNRRAIVIEAKVADSEEMLERECDDALKQIEERQYARKVERSGYRTVIRYGVAFYQKMCLASSSRP